MIENEMYQCNKDFCQEDHSLEVNDRLERTNELLAALDAHAFDLEDQLAVE